MDLIKTLREKLIYTNEFDLDLRTDLDKVESEYRGVYISRVLQNPRCVNFHSNTKSVLLVTSRHHHPTYHRILTSSNEYYSFLVGDPRHINFYAFDWGDPGESKLLNDVQNDKPFIIYTEEMNTVFPHNKLDEVNEGLRKKLEKNFIGFISHVSDTVNNVPDPFRPYNYHLNLPVRDIDFSDDVIDRSLTEEEVVVLYLGSWGIASKEQMYHRGAHLLDAAFMIAKKKCKGLKIVFLERWLNDEDSQAKMEYPNDVHIIRRGLTFMEMTYLTAICDIYGLVCPSLHVSSILDAMQCGMACITSDEYGYNDFVKDNGVQVRIPYKSEIVPNYGRVWRRPETDYLRKLSDPAMANYVEGIADALIKMYEDRRKLATFRRNSLKMIKEEFSIESYIKGMSGIIENFYTRDDERVPFQPSQSIPGTKDDVGFHASDKESLQKGKVF